jgi:hypothetical protein
VTEVAADPAGRLALAANRGRQRTLYGVPFGERVRRLTGLLGISQARLARTIGISPAMLSQLVSGRRVKIGNPTVLARLLLLDHRCRGLPERPAPAQVETLLADVARASWPGARSEGPPDVAGVPPAETGRGYRRRGATPADALRGVAEPARLAAAAAALHPAFPELAELLRQAAGRPRPSPG